MPITAQVLAWLICLPVQATPPGTPTGSRVEIVLLPPAPANVAPRSPSQPQRYGPTIRAELSPLAPSTRRAPVASRSPRTIPPRTIPPRTPSVSPSRGEIAVQSRALDMAPEGRPYLGDGHPRTEMLAAAQRLEGLDAADDFVRHLFASAALLNPPENAEAALKLLDGRRIPRAAAQPGDLVFFRLGSSARVGLAVIERRTADGDLHAIAEVNAAITRLVFAVRARDRTRSATAPVAFVRP